MLQNTSKTLGFQKIMVYKTPPGEGAKPYLARGLQHSKLLIYFQIDECVLKDSDRPVYLDALSGMVSPDGLCQL